MGIATIACFALTIVACRGETTILAPVQDVTTATPTVNPLLQSRIDGEIARLDRVLQRRIDSLMRQEGRLNRTIERLQEELDLNSVILDQLPGLITSILMNNPLNTVDLNDVTDMMDEQAEEGTEQAEEAAEQAEEAAEEAAEQAEEAAEQAEEGGETAESTEVGDRRRRAVISVTSSTIVLDDPNKTTVGPEMPETTKSPVEVITDATTTMAPETTTPAEAAQETTLSPFARFRINLEIRRLSRFVQRRVQRLQRSLLRLRGLSRRYRYKITSNLKAKDDLPELVRELIISPFQRRIRLSRIFRLLRLRRTSPIPDVGLSRKRRQAIDDDVIDTDDDADLKELENEMEEVMEEINDFEL